MVKTVVRVRLRVRAAAFGRSRRRSTRRACRARRWGSSPAAPPPLSIGLSLCRLVRVEGSGDRRDTLVLGGADIMDGTPILDVKPYLGQIGRPLPPSSLEESSEASSEALSSSPTGEGLRVPEWCASQEDASLIREVRFDDAAEMGLRQALLLEDGTAGSGASAGGSLLVLLVLVLVACASTAARRGWRSCAKRYARRSCSTFAACTRAGAATDRASATMRFDALEITFQPTPTSSSLPKLMAPASSNMTPACLS